MYSRGAYSVLPTNDADLSTLYSGSDYSNVATSNDVRVSQAGTDQYIIHQYKDFTGGHTNVNLHWEGQVSQATSIAILYLQIYNYNTASWDTLTTDTTHAAGSDFNIDYFVPDLTNYQDAHGLTASRIYQRVV